MLREVLIPLLYAIAFTAIIYRWRFFRLEHIPAKWMVGAFILKLFAGLVFWLVYSSYYSAAEESDAIRYYNDAVMIHDQWHDDREVFYALMLGDDENTSPGYLETYDKLVGWYNGYRYGLTNDCRAIIRLNVLICFISGGSYHVHWIFMAFMAFLGLTALYKAFEDVMRHRKKLLFVSCFLLPSVIFWSAGLLKEGPTLLGTGLLFMAMNGWMQNHRNWVNYVWLLISISLLIYFKEYVLFAVIPALLFLVLVKLTGPKKMIVKFFIVQIACFFIAQNAHHFFIGGDFLYVLDKKKTDFENTSILRNAGSTVFIPDSENVAEFILHYPPAFALSYLRPFLWESKSWMYLLFALENALYALMLLLTIFFFRRPEFQQWAMLLAAASFVLVFASIIGNCVPVLGSIVRYRIIALPLLSITCLACIDFTRISNMLKKNISGLGPGS